MDYIDKRAYEAYKDRTGYGSELQERRVENESRWAGDAYREAADKVKELQDIIEAQTGQKNEAKTELSEALEELTKDPETDE